MNTCSKKRSEYVEQLIEKLNLGKLLETPIPLTGGLMHRMDQVICEGGTFAVKTLNPHIMKRPEAYRNMVTSEKIAASLKNVVPVVGAMEFGGKQVITVEEKHYMLFPWVEGKSIHPPCLTSAHCEKMGDVLGRMHAARVQVEELEKEAPKETHLDWQLPLLTPSNEAWAKAIREAVPQLERWLKEANGAVMRLSEHQVISHRDLDPKNVLWVKDDPWLIDWEAAGFINPQQELMEMLFYWADDGRGNLQETLFLSFLRAYERHVSLRHVHWDDVFCACFLAPLEWLHYNVRRSCGMEGQGEQECGKKEVLGTLEMLHHLEEKIEIARQYLQNRG